MDEMLAMLREIRDNECQPGYADYIALDQAIAIVEEVARLREQNTRLKVALKPFADLGLDDEDAPDDWDDGYEIYAGDIRRARAELEEG